MKNLKIKSTVVTLLLGILLSGCATAAKESERVFVKESILGEFGEVLLEGFYEKKFEEVYREFLINFSQRGEAGGSVCITRHGRTVLDLWGGYADTEAKTPWTEDTVSVVWSSTKGATSLALNMLISQGLVDLHAPVSDYWPEYGQNGKEKTTVKMVLAHQTGIQHLTAKVKPEGYADWDYIVSLIEEQAPSFEPGTAYGYQALTHGWLVGELVRRVTGKSLGDYIRDEIALPLGADFQLGLEEKDYERAASMIFAELDPAGSHVDFFKKVFFEPESIQAGVFFNDGGYMMAFDSPVYRKADIGAANGYTNARGLASLYLPLANGGSFNGREFVSKEVLKNMGSVYSASFDNTLLIPARFGLGFMKSMDNREDLNPHNSESEILSEAAFGHSGFGGSVGFADPEEGVSFAYTMNRMGTGTLLNPRGQSLVDALYRSLGYTSNETGRWVK